MEGVAAVCSLGHKMRLALWGIISIAVLCLLGLPTMLGFDIEPLHSDTWLYSVYLVLEQFTTPTTIDNEDLLDQAETIAPLTLSLVDTGIVGLILTTSTAIIGALVWQVDRLFALYAKGQVFTAANVKYFGRIGWLLIVMFTVELLAGNWLDLALFYDETLIIENSTVNNAQVNLEAEWPIQTFISLDLTILLSGLFMVIVARVMQLGTQLQQDADATI